LRIGSISYCYHGLDVRSLLAKFREIGFQNIELWFGHPDGRADYMKHDRPEAEDTRDLLAGFGITPQAYCVGGFSETDRPHFRRAFEFAAGLGAPVITGCAVPAIVPELDALCGEYNIRFAIENHRGNPFQGPDDYAAVFEASSPWIGVNLDTGHIRAAHHDVVEATRRLLDRLHHVHLKDIVEPGGGQSCALGTGAAHIGEFLDLLKSRRWDGHLSIEHEIPGDPTEDLKASLQFVRERLG
jgi:sugar phosphate isomerase/epimerase